MSNDAVLQKHLDKCKKCKQAIEENAIRTQEDDVYHADCFTCTQCGVVLHGKFFNVKDEKLCEDCFTVRMFLILQVSIAEKEKC